MHHTDRGSPYASDDDRPFLAAHEIVPSMSGTGTQKAGYVDYIDFYNCAPD